MKYRGIFWEYNRSKDVLLENTNNYDESAFVDNLGNEKGIICRSFKYSCEIGKHSKLLIFIGSFSGYMLPPFVVYKRSEMWTTLLWMDYMFSDIIVLNRRSLISGLLKIGLIKLYFVMSNISLDQK